MPISPEAWATSVEVVCVRLACFLLYGDERLTPYSQAALAVDVDVPAQGVALAPLGRLSRRGEARPLETHGVLAHLVQDIDIVGEFVVLAPERLSLDLAERCVLSTRRLTTGVTGLAHTAQAPGVAAGEVVQAVLHPCLVVDEAGAFSAVSLATPLPVGVDVAGVLVLGAPKVHRSRVITRHDTLSVLNTVASSFSAQIQATREVKDGGKLRTAANGLL